MQTALCRLTCPRNTSTAAKRSEAFSNIVTHLTLNAMVNVLLGSNAIIYCWMNGGLCHIGWGLTREPEYMDHVINVYLT